MKSFIDNQKLREFKTTKPAWQQLLKESLGDEHKRKKTYRNKSKTIKKMVIGMYVSIIILNLNGLSSPNKRHRLVE